MKFTLSWLKDHLETNAGLDEIVERLTALGIEVESVTDRSKALKPFIVAQITEAARHPSADRLQVCSVDTGTETLQVVCGAPNARAGLKTAFAPIGALIPAIGTPLKKGVIRGVESFGMMCSTRELGLGEEHDGIMELPGDAVLGAPLAGILGLDDVVIDVSVTPNRGDCLGVRGIARDLAASGLGWLKPEDREPVIGLFPSPIGISLDLPEAAANACPLFVGRVIRNLRNGDSPDWLKRRLEAIGLRPISALVDITNLLCLDLARPLHVFDTAKLQGDMSVRLSRAGESLAALNGKTYTLDDSMIVVADEAGPQALAGVIGGEPTGCSAETTSVFVESALFDPIRIAATGRKLAIDSDARYRFERGLDPSSALWGMEVATRLILGLCGGEASALTVAGAEPDDRRSIEFRPALVAARGGVEVPEPDMVRILENLGFDVEGEDGMLTVAVPPWRNDIEGPHDLVEEILRINGYDKIPVVPLPRLTALPHPALTPAQRRVGFVKRSLAAHGMVETVTWSFLAAEQARLFAGDAPEIRLANPISADLDVMRPSILPNLIAAAGRNAARGLPDLALFELGPQYAGDHPEDQSLVVAGIRAGRTSAARHWNQPPRAIDVFDAKADALAALEAAGAPIANLQVVAEAPAWYHPGRSGSLRLGPKTVMARFGEIHPGVLRALDVKGPVVGFEVFLDIVPLPKARATRARPLLKPSPFQPVSRDFAFVVDAAVASAQVLRAARDADKALINDASVFDVYEGANLGEGRKSLAVSVLIQPIDRTLTDAEIEAVAAKVVAAVGKATGGVLRG